MSAVTPDNRPAKRGRLGVVLLTLSLTLNVFFIAGLIWSHTMMQPPFTPVQRMQMISREMHLSPEQRESFRDFVQSMREHQRALQHQNRPIIENLWDEMAAAHPDQAKIAALIDQATANRHASQQQTSQALIAFLAKLTPEQRERFAELAKERRQESLLQRLIYDGR